MATFSATPTILLVLRMPVPAQRVLEAYLNDFVASRPGYRDGDRFWHRAWLERDGERYVVDVDIAEKAVAWLKAHGVDSAP